jgi:aryl-alcohol dehydrogenase-like predicted oxidoreductase
VLKNLEVSPPIVGTTKPQPLVDAVAPLDLTLTDDETKALGRAGHHAGTHLVLRSIVGTAC